jgi:catechol 2,3-dioxygenase-like lactoylglutathione lyase family enzyme
MIYGAHVIVYSKDAEADRAFFREILGFKSVDAGHGWLIFTLTPGEAAFHPSADNGPHELYFMCEDLEAEMASFAPGAGVMGKRKDCLGEREDPRAGERSR